MVTEGLKRDTLERVLYLHVSATVPGSSCVATLAFRVLFCPLLSAAAVVTKLFPQSPVKMTK